MLACAATTGAAADAAYPAKPVRIIVPFAAGGSGDAVTRIVAQRMAANTGQPFIVENKTGAGGTTGEGAVARAAPDGYTLGFVSAGHAWLAAMYPNLSFDPAKDLVPIGLIGSVPYVMLARKGAPFNTVHEFVAYAKANPGKVSLASAGVGTLTHLLPAWLMSETGISLIHVPFGGTAPAMNSLLSEQIDVYFDPVTTAMPQVRAGKVKVLATSGLVRPRTAGDVSTLKELGYQAHGATWFALMAPAGVPQPILERLNHELNVALASDDVKKRLYAMDFNIESGSIKSFATFLEAQTQTWGRIVKENAIKSD
jgi:tripartite-type tricarboxylate transporter receptor subunit TctC